MTDFSTLPEECVQLVFDRISIQNLRVICRVSRSWQRHQKLNFTRRKTLIVLHGYSPKEVIPLSFFNADFVPHNLDQNGNSLHIESYIEQNHIHQSAKCLNVKSIVKTFPNVRTLIIASNCVLSPHLRSFNRLIAKYSSKLVTLQMYLQDEIRTPGQQKSVSHIVGSLFNQLNSLTALEHFTLDTFETAARLDNNTIGWQKLNPVINRPIFLTRIKELNIRCRGLAIIMHQCLLKYAKEGELRQLSRINLGAMYSENELRNNNQFASHWPVDVAKCLSFAPYPLEAHNRNKKYFETVITKFSSLNKIKFFLSIIGGDEAFDTSPYTSNVSLSKLAHFLSPLTKLVLLQLHLYDVNIQSEPLDPAITPQLKSIKALELKFGLTLADCSMFRNELDTFVHIFPNLRSIRVINLDKNQKDTNVLTQSARDLAADLKRAYGRESLQVTMVMFNEFEFKL